MSGGGHLLLFAGDGIAPLRRWLRLRDGAIVARGEGLSLPPPPTDESDERIVLVVPGEDVVIHWVALPPLAPAQGQAAARLLAAEVGAAPLDRVHVALGSDAGETRAMALVAAERMAAWLAQAQALGFDPDIVLPEPLLLPLPEDGIDCWVGDGNCLLRGPEIAFAVDPALLPLILPEPTRLIDMAAAEAGFAAALDPPKLDLRQGPFARRRRWRIDWPLVRRLAVLAGLIVLAIIAVQLTLILRYRLDADRLEQQAVTVARDALPRGGDPDDAMAGLAARLAGLRGGGAGFSQSAATLFEAVRETPNVELAAMTFEDNGILRATASASDPADIPALARRLEAAGFAVDTGDIRPGGGRQIAELTVRPQ